jgi:hypothetical protein
MGGKNRENFLAQGQMIQKFFRNRTGEKPQKPKAPDVQALKVVEAAGVEPACLPNKPAATTCLVRRESQPPDNVLTRIRPSSPHEITSAKTAQTPAFT